MAAWGQLTRSGAFQTEPSQDYTGWDEYRFKHEDGRGLRFFLRDLGVPVSLTWKILDKDEQWTYYGESADEQLRIPDRAGSTRIYSWHISHEQDPYGNVIAYHYEPRTSDSTLRMYLSSIDYPPCQVSFSYGSRSDDDHVDYRAGTKLVEGKALLSVTASSASGMAYKYEFGYAEGGSKSSDRMLLTSIVQRGIAGGTLPPLEFEYTEQTYENPVDQNQYAFVPLADTFNSQSYDPFGGVGPLEKQWHLGDFNGDGRMDVIHIRGLDAVAVWLGKEDGTFDIRPDWTGGGTLAGGQATQYRYLFQIGDFNGDGLADVLHVRGDSQANIWFAQLDSQGAFNYFTVVPFSGPVLLCMTPSVPGPFFLPNDPRNAWELGVPLQFVNHIADFNADGKDDILGFYDQATGPTCDDDPFKSVKGRFFIYFSNGNGTFALKEWRIQYSATLPYDFSLPTRGDVETEGSCDVQSGINEGAPRQYGVAVVDVNGDGLPDLLHPKGTRQTPPTGTCKTPLVVFLNQGLSANPANSYDISFLRMPCQTSASVCFASLTQFDPVVFQYGDNGDGALDITNSDEQAGPDVLTMLLSLNDWTEGYDQYEVRDWTTVWEDFRDGTLSGDFNGDRITDYGVVCYGRIPREEYPYPDPDIFLYLGHGDGTISVASQVFFRLRQWFAPINPATFVLVADFTGDGKSDFLSLYWESVAGGHLEWTGMYKSAGDLPDMLSHVKRGGIEVASIAYGTAVSGSHSGVSTVVPVVKQITYMDGLGGSLSFEYAFSGGKFDAFENRFTGFKNIVETYPDGSYAVLEYNNEPVLDRDRQGTVAQRRLYSPTGTLLTDESTDWQVLGGAYPKYAYPALRSSTVYDDALTVSRTEAFAFDPVHFGLAEHVVSGTGAESISTTRSYANLGTYMWKLVNETKTGATSGIVQNTHYEYYTADQPEGKKGSLSSVTEASGSAEARTTSYRYTAEGNIYEIRRQDTASSRYSYDQAGIYPDTVTTFQDSQDYWQERFVYNDRFGAPITRWDRNNNRTGYEYDEYGRPIVAITYNGPDEVSGNIVAETRTSRNDLATPNWTRTEQRAGLVGTQPNYVAVLEYTDYLGRQVQKSVVADEVGAQSRHLIERFVREPNLNREFKYGPFFSSSEAFVGIGSIPSQVAREEKHFDFHGRLDLEARTSEEHGLVSRQYSYAGSSMTVVDEDGRQTRFVRDHIGRVTAVIEIGAGGVESTTSYVQDASGSVTSITDMLGITYNRAFDLLGRLETISHPDLGVLSYSYSAADDILSTAEADSFHIWSDRDALGRCYRTRFERDGSVSSYTYDAPNVANSLGMMTSRQNAQARWSAKNFDPLGNCLEDTVSIAGVSIQSRMRYEYDESSRQTSIRFVGGEAFHSDYEYYPGSSLVKEVRAASVSDLVTLKVSDYSPFGRPGRLEYYHNDETTPFITIDYTLSEADDRIYGILARNQGSDGQPQNDLLNRSYSYSAAGDLLTMIDYKKGDILNKPNNQYVYAYQYDERHRLRKVFEAGSTSPAIETKYDAGGRITEKKFGTRKLTYQYTGSRSHAVSGLVVGTSTYPVTYDQRGNTTSDVGLESIFSPINRAFNYGPENRVDLVTYGPPGVPEPTEVTIAYGPDGMRVRKSITGGLSTFYYNRYFELDNYVDGSNYDALKYVFLGRRRIMQRGPTGTLVLISDMLGSVNVTCNTAGQPVYSVDYDAWGRPKDAAGAGYQKWQYTGQERGMGEQLFAFMARVYDGGRGMFLAPDPLGIAQAGPQRLNGYSYCLNNPASRWDPLGLQDEDSSYLDRAWQQLLKGNYYSGEPTLLGTGAQVVTGIAGIDLPADIRDIYYDVSHWELSMPHIQKLMLDAVGLVPVVGAMKYGDEAHDILRASNKLANKQFRQVAKEYGFTTHREREAFRRYLEKNKRMAGRGGGDNRSMDELRRLAEEFKGQ